MTSFLRYIIYLKRKPFNVAFALALALALTLMTAIPANANATVTPAGGGTAISSGTVGGTYTSLGTITITEGSNGDLPSNQTNKTLILNAPGGFQFNALQIPSITHTGTSTSSADITTLSVAISSTQITVTLSTDGNANKLDNITIGATTAIQVRPTAGTPLATGQIYRPTFGGGSATINGIIKTSNTNGSGGTNLGTLTEVAGALDHFAISTISSPQTAGTAITGITLTAKDVNNNTVTNFVSAVTYGGTAGITGSSGVFTAGVLNGVSVTPTTAGTGMTFTVTGLTKTGTATFNVNPGAASATQSTLTPTSATISADGTSTQILTVTAKDANGNYLSTGGAAVTITKQSGTGAIGSVTDNSNGTYTAAVTAPGSAGNGVFIATLGGQPVKNGTASQTPATITCQLVTHTITASAGSHGSISPSGSISVHHGASQAFNISPDTGYHVAVVLVDSVSVGTITTYTFNNVTAAHTISASFAINSYTLTYTSGTHGSITGTTPQTVNYGNSGTQVTAIPDAGYHFTTWSDGVLTAARTDANISASIAVTATFAINGYALTYTAGVNGSISGVSPQSVNYGADGTLVTAVPDPGYHFVNWSDAVLTAARTDTNVTSDITVTLISPSIATTSAPALVPTALSRLPARFP